MMSAVQATPLLDRLPPLRGTVEAGASLAPFTWFRVGGPAEILVRPADSDDLCHLLRALGPEIPVTVIGVGSNLLIRDLGIGGVVIRLGSVFAQIEPISPTIIQAGAAALDTHVAQAACRAGIAGLEFLRGVPGTVGGAIAMNAGAYSAEIAECLIEIEIVTRDGRKQIIPRADLEMVYRSGGLPEGVIVTSARFFGRPDDPALISARMDDIQNRREQTQPIRSKTGGSTFRNPIGHKAWELIDQAGCRGLTMGQAKISELHCNFMINLGNATAAELEALGEEVRRRVLAQSGIQLEWEIKRLGQGIRP
jgi:UDP-N-acetylmuramate dehydrogenase